jgi:hypothetical protein
MKFWAAALLVAHATLVFSNGNFNKQSNGGFGK